jgi:PIN domain nuclease of toxin-antitoxin system
VQLAEAFDALPDAHRLTRSARVEAAARHACGAAAAQRRRAPRGETRWASSPTTTNQVLLTAADVWDIAITRALRKLVVPDGYLALLLGAGVQALPVTIEHDAAVKSLPWHHRDPFGRMLVAQASIEQAALVWRDNAFRAYDVAVVW